MNIRSTSLIILIILLIDQISKVYIKTHFVIGQSVPVFEWFQIHFVENDGMAWGTKISDFVSFINDRTAKLILTIFRIIAVTGIGIWLYNTIKKEGPKTLIFAIALIFAGALGNIIDSVFYGLFFSDSYSTIAEVFPKEGGYDDLFYGKVVDMLHFPIWSGTLPEGVPLIGGRNFSFFDPVFNVADVAISTGIGILLFFNKSAFSKKQDSKIDIPYEESRSN